MSRKLHPRWERNAQAKLMIGNAIYMTMVKHELTHAELVSILAESIGQWTKSAIKQEREEKEEVAKADPEPVCLCHFDATGFCPVHGNVGASD